MLRAPLHEQEIRKVIGLPGTGERTVDGVARLDDASDRCLYFINKRITPEVIESLNQRRGCIVITPENPSLHSIMKDSVVLEVADPRAAIAKVMTFIRAEHRSPPWVKARQIAETANISPLAVIGDEVEIGDGVTIEPFCVIDQDVSIRRASIVKSGARINPRVVIGEESVIRSNVVIGADGYGFVRDEAGNKTRIAHLGGVMIGNHVEIGESSVIEAGTISPTIIEDYAKLAASVFVGHNVCIQRNASVTPGVIIAGSAIIGADTWIGINSSIRDGRRVGAHALVGMDSSVQEDLPDNTIARAPVPEIKTRSENDDHHAIGFAKPYD